MFEVVEKDLGKVKYRDRGSTEWLDDLTEEGRIAYFNVEMLYYSLKLKRLIDEQGGIKFGNQAWRDNYVEK